MVKVQGKVHPRTDREGPERCRGIALLCVYPRSQKNVGDQRHASTALPPGKILVSRCTLGCVGPQASLDGYENSRPHEIRYPDWYIVVEGWMD
jgi:hypothetical protein